MGFFHTDLEQAEMALKKGDNEKAVKYFEKYAQKQPYFGVVAICDYALSGKYCLKRKNGGYSISDFDFYDMSAYKDYSTAARWCRYGLQEAPKTPRKYTVPDLWYYLILAIVSESSDERMQYLHDCIFRYNHSDAAYYAMCHRLVDKVCKNEQEKMTLYKTVILGRSQASDDSLFREDGRLWTPDIRRCWLFEQLNRKKQKERTQDALSVLAKLVHKGNKLAVKTMQEIIKEVSQRDEERFRGMFAIDKMKQDELGVHWLYDDNTEVIFNDDYTFTLKKR